MKKHFYILFAGIFLPGLPVFGQQGLPISKFLDVTDQIIIKLRAEKGNKASVFSAKKMSVLSSIAGKPLSHKRVMSGNANVLRLPSKINISEVEDIVKRLKADPSVEYAEPDRIKKPMAAPNDTSIAWQWHYFGALAGEDGGANLIDAWDINTGANNIVVAVLDTGLLTHVDIDSTRVLPGYDMISDLATANDGDARDSDPSDPGDLTIADECYSGSLPSNSSWHGTHVAGTIGANTNNNLGVAGVNWNSKILPVRVLGKCGGYTSDINDGIRWAAGLVVPGIPNNPNPAKVINISLGGLGVCGISEQAAISEAVAAGASVVVAAGNSSDDASLYSPANCDGVITVAAVNRSGGMASYSNYGATIEIAAPGGEGAGLSIGVLSTCNDGLTVPANDDYCAWPGTSMATPHVAGIVSLMVSIKYSLTPAEITYILKSTARNFPTGTGSDCTTANCGAGIIDAKAALQYVSQNNSALVLKDIKAYPNPIYFTSNYLTIAGIPTDATNPKVYIYNVAGELVKTLKEGAGIVHMPYWDGKNESGEKVASGLYIYLVKTGIYGKTTGKFYVFW